MYEKLILNLAVSSMTTKLQSVNWPSNGVFYHQKPFMNPFVFILLVSDSKNDKSDFSYADVIDTFPWPHPLNRAPNGLLHHQQQSNGKTQGLCHLYEPNVPSLGGLFCSNVCGQKWTELLYVSVCRNAWGSWPSSVAPHGVGLNRIALAIAATSLSRMCFKQRCATLQCKSDGRSKETISADCQNARVIRLRVPGEVWVPARS